MPSLSSSCRAGTGRESHSAGRRGRGGHPGCCEPMSLCLPCAEPCPQSQPAYEGAGSGSGQADTPQPPGTQGAPVGHPLPGSPQAGCPATHLGPASVCSKVGRGSCRGRGTSPGQGLTWLGSFPKDPKVLHPKVGWWPAQQDHGAARACPVFQGSYGQTDRQTGPGSRAYHGA